MSKHINVNPDFYKVGGREHSEASDKAELYDRQKQNLNAHDSAPGVRNQRARAIFNARGRSKKK
jgi:hypothetical protein